MPEFQKPPKPLVVVGDHSIAYGRPDCERRAPIRNLRFSRQYTERADLVEHIEVAEYRAEHSVNQRKLRAIEIWAAAKAALQKCKFVSQCLGFCSEHRLVAGRIKADDVVQCSGSEFDPGSMVGAAQRVCRMQWCLLRFLQVFEDNSAFEYCDVVDLKYRRLPKWRYCVEPIRLVRKIDVEPFEGNALLGQRNYCALRI